MTKSSIVFALTSLLLYGCGTAPSDSANADLRDAIGARAGAAFATQPIAADAQARTEQTRALLQQPLTLDAALRVALLNSPRLQEQVASLAIVAAERAQAAQLANPVVSLQALPSLGAGPATLEFGILGNIIDLLTQPHRAQMAEATYDQAKFASAAAVVAVAQDIRIAYIDLVAAQNALAVQRELTEAAAAGADLATKFHDAGNIPTVNLRLEQAARVEAEADLADRELDVETARARLAVVIGVDGGDWRVPALLPPASAETAAPSGDTDVGRRLDVQAARASSLAALAELKYRSGARLWRDAGLGLAAQREGAVPWTVGPQLQLALPIFNQGRAEVARAAAAAVKADQMRVEIELSSMSQIRLAQITLRAAERRVARYRDELLPLRTEIVGLKMKEYSRMFVGAFDVLTMRKAAATADLGYVAALRDYWQARAALDAALGGGTPIAPTFIAGVAP